MPPKNKKKDVQASKSSPSQQQSTIPVPNWPLMQPLFPESDLSLQETLPGQIVTIPNFWTSTLCKTYVSFLSSLPLTTTPGRPKKGDAVRVNDRFQVDDSVFAERLWSETSLKNLILGTNEDGRLGLSEQQRRELWGGDVVTTASVSELYAR